MSVFVSYIRLSLRKAKIYSFDTIMGVLNSFIYVLLGLIFIKVIYSYIPDTSGIDVEMLLTVYILFQISSNYFFLFFTGILHLPEYIFSGEYSKFAVRPHSVLKGIIYENINYYELPNILVNYIILISLNAISFNTMNILLVIIIPIVTSFIMGALSLIIASLCFYFVNAGRMIDLIFPISELGQYPLVVYPKALASLLTFIPVGFIAYYPSIFIVTGHNVIYLYATLAVSVISFALSLWVYNVGKKFYFPPAS